MATKEEIQRIKYILDEAIEVLCEGLEPAKILRSLKAKHVLNDSEVSSITSSPEQDVRVENLLTKLKRKDMRCYYKFLEVLHEERKDLYLHVKSIEREYDRRNGEASSRSQQRRTNKPGPTLQYVKPQATSAMPCTLTDKDIRCVTHKVKLLGDQLMNLYKELELEDHEIENAKGNARTTDYKLQGDKVLQHWRSTRGEKATRMAVIRGLKECECVNAVQTLKEMWEFKNEKND